MTTVNTTSLPPLADPTSLQLATQLLAALSDPEGTSARLKVLKDAQDSFLTAKRAHDDSAASAAVSAATLGDLTALAAKLADDQAELDHNTTALAVASEANAKRGRDLDERERALYAQTVDLQRRISSHDARVKQFRDTVLAG
jgi:hypothetical protein